MRVRCWLYISVRVLLLLLLLNFLFLFFVCRLVGYLYGCELSQCMHSYTQCACVWYKPNHERKKNEEQSSSSRNTLCSLTVYGPIMTWLFVWFRLEFVCCAMKSASFSLAQFSRCWFSSYQLWIFPSAYLLLEPKRVPKHTMDRGCGDAHAYTLKIYNTPNRRKERKNVQLSP